MKIEPIVPIRSNLLPTTMHEVKNLNTLNQNRIHTKKKKTRKIVNYYVVKYVYNFEIKKLGNLFSSI